VSALRPSVVSDLFTAIADKYRDESTDIRGVKIGEADGLLVSRMVSKKSEKC
jgi:predicted regulator of Ras-like GTPase activity (Roadblock/LC7/MglB family)